jgi:hypothetical protein
VFTEHPVRRATVAYAERFGGPAVCASGLRKGAVCKTVGLNAGDMRKVDFTRSRIRPYIDQARRLQRRWQALARLINSASCQY